MNLVEEHIRLGKRIILHIPHWGYLSGTRNFALREHLSIAGWLYWKSLHCTDWSWGLQSPVIPGLELKWRPPSYFLWWPSYFWWCPWCPTKFHFFTKAIWLSCPTWGSTWQAVQNPIFCLSALSVEWCALRFNGENGLVLLKPNSSPEECKIMPREGLSDY